MSPANRLVMLGIGFWGASLLVLTVAFSSLSASERERSAQAIQAIASNAFDAAPRRTIHFAKVYPWLEPGDGIYRRSEFDLVRCGQVISVSDVEDGRRIVAFFDPAIAQNVNTEARITAFSSGASIAWTYRSLLPQHVRDSITAEWGTFVRNNEQRVRDILLPVAREIMAETTPLLLAEAEAAIDRHRTELDAIVNRYRNDVLDPRLIPILERKVWPLLIQHAGPTLREAGNELWDAMPVASLAWNGVAQNFDFSKEDRVANRFERYLEDHGFPILKRRTADLQSALSGALKEAASDPEIESEIEHALVTLLSDQELRAFVLRIANEVATSPAVREAVRGRLTAPAVVTALDQLRQELDGVFQRIGRKVVFSNEETLEVHPDFARFLRTLVLKKDRRWILLEEGPSGSNPFPEDTVLAGTVAPE